MSQLILNPIRAAILAGSSARQIAQDAGVSHSALSRLLRGEGEMSDKMSRALRRYLGEDCPDPMTLNEALQEIVRLQSALLHHKQDRQYIIGWNDGYDHAKSEEMTTPAQLSEE